MGAVLTHNNNLHHYVERTIGDTVSGGERQYCDIMTHAVAAAGRALSTIDGHLAGGALQTCDSQRLVCTRSSSFDTFWLLASTALLAPATAARP